MKQFIDASKIKKKEEIVDFKKVDKFISKFNSEIKKEGVPCSMNDVLDKLPHLNDAEFNHAITMANNMGYTLRRKPDNYQTTSYYLDKLN